MAMKKKTETTEISVLAISQGLVRFNVLGTTPLIFNCVSEKAKRELLLPNGRKTAADKAASFKHDPLAEYRNSVYRNIGDDKPTRLCFPAPGFKRAMMTAALDIPGTKKTEIGRLSWVNSYRINVWGIPQLLMSVVRNSDMNHTPDIRTRAILPQWCAQVEVEFVRPKLTVTAVSNLMAAAGVLAGVGDWRQEKGSASHGQFRLVDAKDEDFKRIINEGGLAAQDAALNDPGFYDLESEELYTWFTAEIKRRSRGESSGEEMDEAA
jgi:hypothetical protein